MGKQEGESLIDATEKDAQIMLSGEECAGGTVQRGESMYAAAKGAQLMLRREVFALGMQRNYAAVMDAQMEPSKEECA